MTPPTPAKLHADEGTRAGARRAAWYRGKPFRRLQAATNALIYRYPHRNLFVAALPKSGSTWIERMLGAIPGYRPWVPEYITIRDHTVVPESFQHLPVGYTITKLHCSPTQAHLDLFNSLQRPYVILHRDLRDVVVSAYFYQRNVVGGDFASRVGNVDQEDGMKQWMDERLRSRVEWVDGWLAGRDPKWSMVVRYEDLLRDTRGTFEDICDHYELDLRAAQVRRIVEQHAFKRATGRRPGASGAKAFNRKGIAGDWQNHFTLALKDQFKAIAGDALVRFGYESGNDW